MATMSIVCIQLAEKMKDCGLDPNNARTFGILAGFDKAHLVVCFSQFAPSSSGGLREIYTCVSMHDHWLLNLSDLKQGRMTNQIDPSQYFKFDFTMFNDN